MVVDSTAAVAAKKTSSPENEITKLTRTTARAFLSRNVKPKYKYIEDPSHFINEQYENEYSQYNMEYYELKLSVWPNFGRFAGYSVSFYYDWDTVYVNVEDQSAYVMILRAGTSPENFQRFCLNFLYSSDPDCLPSKHELQVLQPVPECKPVPLSVRCLRSLIINMEKIPLPELQLLPAVYQGLFPQECLLQVTFNLWPRNLKGERAVLTIRRDMVISEVKTLLQHKLNLVRGSKIRIFKNGLRLADDDIVKSKSEVTDCVISLPGLILTGEGPHVSITSKEVLVVSVVGKEIKELRINLSLPLKYLDVQLRQVFKLKPWSFIAMYLPEEDKNIFHTGRTIYTSYEEEFAKILVSNGKRNFPKPENGLSTLAIKQMYIECTSFKKSLCNLGFYPGSLVEVFEITGPSIPVLYCGSVTKAQVIDVNPDWSLSTFLYYMEVSTPNASKIQSIDYVRDCNSGKVRDVLHMMQSLWSQPNDCSQLEYLKIRS